MLAFALGMLLLAGCVAETEVIRFDVTGYPPQYVTPQLRQALEDAGYRQVAFRSFRTKGVTVREVRSAAADEFRYAREDGMSYVAEVYFDKAANAVTVRLLDRKGQPLGAEARPELERVRARLRDSFGDVVVR